MTLASPLRSESVDSFRIRSVLRPAKMVVFDQELSHQHLTTADKLALQASLTTPSQILVGPDLCLFSWFLHYRSPTNIWCSGLIY